MKRIAMVAGTLLVLVAFAGVFRPEGAKAVDDTTPRDTVSVTGNGAVAAIPDRAAITAGVESRASTAQNALSENAKDMQAVIDALKAAGGKNITTSTVSLNPTTTPEGAPNGYSATNTVTAEFALGAAGKAIDAAVAAGANTIYGPTFTNSDRDALYKKALAGRGCGREGARRDARVSCGTSGRCRDHDQRVVRRSGPALRGEGRCGDRVDADRLRSAGHDRHGLRHLRAEVGAGQRQTVRRSGSQRVTSGSNDTG